MRLVLDTNVVVSALLWGGNPERLIAAAAHADTIVSGDADLQTLVRYRGIEILSPAQAIAHIGS